MWPSSFESGECNLSTITRLLLLIGCRNESYKLAYSKSEDLNCVTRLGALQPIFFSKIQSKKIFFVELIKFLSPYSECSVAITRKYFYQAIESQNYR